jgi:hypothetical protein
MVHNLLLLTILSACGGFLSSQKSVARGALQTFLPKRTLPPHKNIPCGAAPIGLYFRNKTFFSYLKIEKKIIKDSIGRSEGHCLK